MAKYEVWIDDPLGNRLALLDTLDRMTYVKTVNNPGYFSIQLPASFDVGLIRKDAMVEIWRQPTNGAMALDFLGFLRGWIFGDAPESIEIHGPGYNYLLTSRIIAYAAGSTEAYKTDQADDMLKDIFNENFLSGASDTTRDWTGNGLSVAADLADAPSVTLAFSRQPVLETMQKIAEVSAGEGTDLYFDLVPLMADQKISAVFTTFINQPGADRTYTGGIPVYFGSRWGNLERGSLEYDYTDEVTYVYAGGQGEGDYRVIETAQDTTREVESPWGRREGWIDARNESSSDGVDARASEGLAAGEGKGIFRASLLDTEQARYGRDWRLGDRVTCEFRGQEFDALVRQVQVTLHDNGTETISARVEVEL